jgi:uncharacterized protein YeeX (DUF496 family)
LKKSVQDEQTQISLLNAKLDIIQHIVKDTEKIKQVMDIVATKLEKRLDALGTMMIRAQDLRKQTKTLSQSALQSVSKGHKKTHSKSYSFGQMSVEEQDDRPEFDFEATKEVVELQKYGDPKYKYVQDWKSGQLKILSRERESERGLTMRLMMSRSPGSDGRGQGGRTGHWFTVGILGNYRGVQLYDPKKV